MLRLARRLIVIAIIAFGGVAAAHAPSVSHLAGDTCLPPCPLIVTGNGATLHT